MPSPSKRRRTESQQSTLDDASVDTAAVEAPAPPSLDLLPPSPEQELTEDDIAAWNAFCEEYYDIVEQLPLELKRSFLLVHELEQAMQDSSQKLHSSIIDYIAQKRIYDAQTAEEKRQEAADVSAEPELSATDLDDPEALANSLFPAKDRLPDPSTPEPSPLERLRTLASEAAKASRIAIRAGEDKVQQAIAIYDSVDRHIRRLDADLAKYEDSLVIGLRSGTLPSTEAPSLFAGDSKHTSTSVGALRPSAAIVTAAAIGEDARRSVRVRVEDEPRELRQTSQAPRQSTLAVSVRKEEEKRSTSAPPASRKKRPPNRGRKAAAASDDLDIDPDEPVYCRCRRVSFGEMIACDGPECKVEWFHLECVGLKDAPRGKYYCKDCVQSLGIQTRRRK